MGYANKYESLWELNFLTELETVAMQTSVKNAVMIVEDEAVTALDLEEYLESLGYRVVASVASGEEAIESIEKNKPDMVLLDIGLAGVFDGIETAQLIKEKFNIPIVFISAYYDETKLEMALKHEPYGFICKPINKNDLKITIRMALHMSVLNANKIDALNKLKESEEKIRRLNENLADGMVYQIDSGMDGLEREFSYLSPAVERLHGLKVEDVQQNPMRLYRQLLDEDLAKVAIFESKAFETQTPFHAEVRVRLPSGDIRWRRFMSSPRKNADGRILWDGIEMDITDQKLKEFELEKSEKKYRFIAEKSLQGIALISSNPTRFIYVNPVMSQIFGYTEKEFMVLEPEEIWGLVYPEDIPEVRKRLQSRFDGIREIYQYRIRIVRKNGETGWVEVNSNLTEYNGELASLAIFMDITQTMSQTELSEQTG